MIYAYINPNSVAFSLSEQKSIIERWCQSESRRIDEWIEGEDESRFFSRVQKGDFMVVSDFARFGQDKGKILALVKYFLSNGINVVSASKGIVLNAAKISSENLSLVVDMLSEIDFNLLSEKTRIGLAKALEKGNRSGRKVGQKPGKVKLSGHEEEIRQALSNGETKASLARRYKVTWITMNEFVKNRL